MLSLPLLSLVPLLPDCFLNFVWPLADFGRRRSVSPSVRASSRFASEDPAGEMEGHWPLEIKQGLQGQGDRRHWLDWLWRRHLAPQLRLHLDGRATTPAVHSSAGFFSHWSNRLPKRKAPAK